MYGLEPHFLGRNFNINLHVFINVHMHICVYMLYIARHIVPLVDGHFEIPIFGMALRRVLLMLVRGTNGACKVRTNAQPSELVIAPVQGTLNQCRLMFC